MKKVLNLSLAVWVGLLFVVPGGMAAKKPKLKKIACYTLDGGGSGNLDGYRLVIGAKKSGIRLRDIDSIVKYYKIVGALGDGPFNIYPISGSAYHHVNYKYYWGEFSGNITGYNIDCSLYIKDKDNATDNNVDCSRSPGAPGDDVSKNYVLIETVCGSLDFDSSLP